MFIRLPYGSQSQLELEFSDQLSVTDFHRDRGTPLVDPINTLRQAIQEPIEYPEISLSVTPDDRVAIPVDLTIPKLAALVVPIIDSLLKANIRPEHITFLAKEARGELDPRSELAAEIRSAISFEIHDPTDEARCAYLATTEPGERIYLNRYLTEADFVLPIECFRHQPFNPVERRSHGLFPTFSNEETLKRYRSLQIRGETIKKSSEGLTEAEEVGWLLGVHCTIQILLGTEGKIHQVIAGDPSNVFQQAREITHHNWTDKIDMQADLVIVTISGESPLQTWEQFANAICNASQLVEDNGTIVICSDVGSLEEDCELTAGMSMLQGDVNPSQAVTALEDQLPSDALPTIQIAHALSHNTIAIYGALPEYLTQELSMTYLPHALDVQALIEQASSTLILRDGNLIRLVSDVE